MQPATSSLPETSPEPRSDAAGQPPEATAPAVTTEVETETEDAFGQAAALGSGQESDQSMPAAPEQPLTLSILIEGTDEKSQSRAERVKTALLDKAGAVVDIAAEDAGQDRLKMTVNYLPNQREALDGVLAGVRKAPGMTIMESVPVEAGGHQPGQAAATATPPATSDAPGDAPGEAKSTAEAGTTEDEPTAPEPGSDAAVSLEFGSNLARIREQRNLTQHQLAANTGISPDSIRDYELGKHRPKQPALWSLARALDVMPISIGPGSVRGSTPPVPTDVQLRQKGNRALRLQFAITLLGFDEVSAFNTRLSELGAEAADVYEVASSSLQLTEEQLAPFLLAFPVLRREWLLNGGSNEPLQEEQLQEGPAPRGQVEAAQEHEAAMEEKPEAGPVQALAAEEAITSTPAAMPTAAPETPSQNDSTVSAYPSAAYMDNNQPFVVPEVGGGASAQYLPLGGGLMAEVGVLTLPDGGQAITSFCLMARAGIVAGITTTGQLTRLTVGLQALLDRN